jgi:hypothetical protein
MSLKVNDVDALQQYLGGVLKKANHHAGNADDAVLLLLGAVVLYKDADTPIQVHARKGSVSNIVWIYMGGTRFALRHDPDADNIQLRRGVTLGSVVATFDNTTPVSVIRKKFEELSKGSAATPSMSRERVFA